MPRTATSCVCPNVTFTFFHYVVSLPSACLPRCHSLFSRPSLQRGCRAVQWTPGGPGGGKREKERAHLLHTRHCHYHHLHHHLHLHKHRHYLLHLLLLLGTRRRLSSWMLINDRRCGHGWQGSVLMLRDVIVIYYLLARRLHGL